jgi:hypothetical protein
MCSACSDFYIPPLPVDVVRIRKPLGEGNGLDCGLRTDCFAVAFDGISLP